MKLFNTAHTSTLIQKVTVSMSMCKVSTQNGGFSLKISTARVVALHQHQ